ncbi:MAG: GAF domain-containing protein [Anaerolineae bacterium]|nr:MAG: GAF domain-containing protein [Anaerolineae bacterium]
MSFTSELRTPYELRQTIRQLAQLVEISVTLNSTLEIDRLLQYIIETATNLLNCEAASILLYDPQEDKLVFAAATGSDPAELAKIPVPIEGSIAGKIFSENAPYIVNDMHQAPQHYNKVGERVKFETRSLLGVPMRSRDNVIGVLEALNKREGEFTSNDIRLLSVTASHASVAIENARLVSALRRANEELEKANRLKSDFIAIASHELRTPLGLILGYASFLKEEAQGELSEHAEMVLNSALRLRSLVEDMTNLDMLQKGKATLHRAMLPIQQVVLQAYQEARSAAETKGQHIKLRLPKNDILVYVDAEKMHRVFTNLFNNAIRFTPPDGHITIRVSATRRKVGIEVRDTGPGIPESELENIFHDFYQVENHLTRHYGGLGIGLSIAKGIVENHGGRIWAENNANGPGAVFKVLLPRGQATE